MIDIKAIINTIITDGKVLTMFCVLETLVISFLLLFSKKSKNIYHSNTVKLTDKIEVPVPVGEGQYGTSWWLNKKDYDKVFNYHIIDRNKEYNNICFSSGGIIVNFERKNNQEKIHYINDNLHILLVGASGSGKSRSILIPSITMLGLSGENLFISDVKGELFLYTAPKLKELGYDVIALDFINFLKSNHYNFLDLVINAVEDNNIPLAESLVNDIVNILVEKNDKTEPIWVNGEMSIIKTAIMAVVLENRGKREYQTLANAYYFVAEMFQYDDDGEMLIDKYMKNKKADDPIKKFFAIASTAPTKTRGSFISAALSTLQMFVSDYVADTVQKSDFDLRDFTKKKTAIYVLLNDDKLTYHKLASLLVQQIYTAIVDTSRVSGGELPIRMNFILDEFANFTKIETLQSMLTVSRSRNCRFVMAVQSIFGQLEEKYGKKFLSIITLIAILIGTCSKTLAVNIGDKIKIEDLGDCGYHLQYWDSENSRWSYVKTTMAGFKENGVTHYAYCLNVKLPGVEEGEYSVNINKMLNDKHIYTAIINSFPYKTPKELGVANKYDAFALSKHAIYSVMYDRDVRKYYKGGDERGKKMVNAMEKIVNKARNNPQTPSTSTNIEIKEQGKLKKDTKKGYYSQTYSVSADAEVSKYKVSINNHTKGTIVTDINGKEKNEFESEEKFKILIPKENIRTNKNISINVTGDIKNYPIFLWKSTNRKSTRLCINI